MSEKEIIKGGSFVLDQIDPKDVFTPEDFTDEHKMILQTSYDFLEKEILPFSDRIESKDKEFSLKLMADAGELGLCGTDVPEAYGGLGLDKVSTAAVTEALGASGSFATTHGAHTGIATLPIVFFGTEEQKQKYLPGLASGETIGAYALTEPSAGSDAMGGCKTRAVLSADGKYYILNGQKIFITNGAWADTFVAYAKVDGDQFTAFIVERGFPGVSTGPEESKLGIKGSSTTSVIFEDAQIPVENVLHEIGKGHQVAFNILNVGRYKLGAATVGACKLGVKRSVLYAKVREQFGLPIAQFGAIKEKLADMAAKAFLNESIAYRSAGLFEDILASISSDDPDYGRKAADAIREYAIECSINKLFGSEAVDFIVDECVQIHGGYGYIDEYPAERAYRDARILRIYEGTNEINRQIVLGELMGRAVKGKLPVFEAAAKIEAAPGESSLPSAGPLAREARMIEQCKKAVIMVSAAAAQKFGMELTKEQEVVSRLGDMIVEIYAMETGLLRAQKIEAKQGAEAAKWHKAMVTAYLEDAMPSMAARAKAALCRAQSCDPDQLAALAKLLEYDPIDAIAVKREIADRVIEKDGMPY